MIGPMSSQEEWHRVISNMNISLTNEKFTLQTLSLFPSLASLSFDTPQTAIDHMKVVLEAVHRPLLDTHLLADKVCSNIFRISPYSPYDFCSGVVDYDFYLPDDATVASMSVHANQLGSIIPTVFPNACLSDFKRLICSTIYLPCSSSGFGVQMPCKGLCTSLHANCGPLIAQLGIPGTDCSLFPFDASNDPAICNDLASTNGQQLVADSSEAYIGKTCAGITSNVYNAPTSYPFSPLLPPFVQQGIREGALAATEALVPIVMPAKCLLDRRKLACGTYFQKPEPIDALYGYFGTTYAPQMPHQQICENFMQSCKGNAFCTSIPS